jgi:hypothetical protein
MRRAESLTRAGEHHSAWLEEGSEALLLLSAFLLAHIEFMRAQFLGDLLIDAGRLFLLAAFDASLGVRLRKSAAGKQKTSGDNGNRQSRPSGKRGQVPKKAKILRSRKDGFRHGVPPWGFVLTLG